MSVIRSADLDADIRRWDEAQRKWEESLPKCEKCGCAIDDYVWEIDDDILCEDCAAAKFRRNVEDYVR